MTDADVVDALNNGATLVLVSRWRGGEAAPDILSLRSGARLPVHHSTAVALLGTGALDYYGGCTETTVPERWYRATRPVVLP